MDFMTHAMTAKRQTKRWPMLMFYNMLDLASIASLVVFRSKFPDSQFSKSARRRFFQLEVAKGLLVPQMERRRMIKHLPRQLATTIDLVLDKDPEGDTQAQNAAQSTALRSKRK
ncbi:PiggyBac transposable element-derived protein 4 [Plakobranchus ocellatus]|uniref:PiggyBac transposable element-derived protein 4 n=1 Tax=Plakobranchus ocellatus TaxID=259542 RepID=A0AAV3YYM8_9GAST|nr:PiggyBac transposable element-derived protein 4 [Plakobranchus ocellatus]